MPSATIGHSGEQSRVEQVAGGDVHSEVEGPARGMPGGRLAQGVFENPGGEGVDEAARLGHRKRVARSEQAAARVWPTHQRFDAGDGVSVQVEFGFGFGFGRPEPVPSWRSRGAVRCKE
jgi:hypothetical protein